MKHLKDFSYWKAELRSVLTTALAFLAVDGSAHLLAIYSGDWSQTVLLGLAITFGRSIIKAILTVAFPSLFPPRINK